MKKLLTLVLALMLALTLTEAEAESLLPEATGKTIKKDGDLTVDCSNMSQGYIMVKGKKSKNKYKVQVSTAGAKLKYDLNMDGEYEVFPLQFGSGKYKVELYRNDSGNKYSKEGTVELNVQMDNKLSCFLYPNQYVNFNADTPCVVYTAQMCEGMTDQAEIFKAVCNYIKSNFVYDFIKSATVKQGQLPQIDECWNSRMGICQDLAAMCCAMLRSQGIPARLVIGTDGNTPHAWVVAVVNGENKTFDPANKIVGSKAKSLKKERWY